jgi:proline iminopeptidase
VHMRAVVNGTELYFDVDGAELRIADGRLAAKPTLIALHGGLGFDHGYLKPGLGPLREHAQVIYVDLRGQGRSARPPLATCSLEQTADDIASLCALLGVAKPIVFGHSAGGFVALLMAIRHPERVGALILCDALATCQTLDEDDVPTPQLAERASPEALEAASRLFTSEFTAENVKNFLDKVGPYYAAPSHMDVPERLISLTSVDIEMMRHFQTLRPGYDVRPALGSIAAATLVVTGRHDWICPPKASRAMARAIPGAALVELADAGHFGFSEEPQKFQDAVVPFLNNLAARPAD